MCGVVPPSNMRNMPGIYRCSGGERGGGAAFFFIANHPIGLDDGRIYLSHMAKSYIYSIL
jgi:hypothetical protein